MNADPRSNLKAKAAGFYAAIERINGAEAEMENWIHEHDDVPVWFPGVRRLLEHALRLKPN